LRSLETRLIPTTVLWVPSQLTPYQEHSLPEGPSQPVLTVQLDPLVLPYRAIRASRSVLGMAAVATAAGKKINTVMSRTMKRVEFTIILLPVGGTDALPSSETNNQF
jgi:hypothetical protein